mmetsp:Transcript_6633/g.20907  ORF Transcript_6633/g.20907 Transcript_6633/m.20907 type:complete len:268 (-) Transcript_6633:205-1008(-)
MDGLSWQTIIDQQWIDNFSWRAAPLSDVRVVAATAAAYVALALLAKRRADARPKPSPPGPSYLLAAHSLVLCAASYVMCRGAVKASLARGASEGWGWFFCETQTEAPRLYYYAYLYYLSKYYELLDTFLPFLAHGRLPRHFGLHVFHHAAVLFMAWGYVEYRQTLAFGGLIANTGVHVVMYYYYARAALKLRTAWKAWVTRLQIFQFSVSFALLVVTLSGVHGPVASCAGGRALAGNVAFNAILLFLFVGVLGSSKKEPKKDARKRA